MCFSPEMDATAGLMVTAIGVDALRHVRKPEQVALACLPVLFGLHQLIETFVWLHLQGHVGRGLGDMAAWIYLLIAVVIVPLAVPYAFSRLNISRRPSLDRAFLVAGGAAAAADAYALGIGPLHYAIDGHQITYSIGVPFLPLTLGLYVIAACGPALAARSPLLRLFGLLNLVVVAVLAALNQGGVISLWCVWAAVTSILINLYVRGYKFATKDVPEVLDHHGLTRQPD